MKPRRSLHITEERWEKAWRSEGVSGMQQVARFHDAGLRDRVRDKIHDSPLTRFAVDFMAFARLSIDSISRVTRYEVS